MVGEIVGAVDGSGAVGQPVTQVAQRGVGVQQVRNAVYGGIGVGVVLTVPAEVPDVVGKVGKTSQIVLPQLFT